MKNRNYDGSPAIPHHLQAHHDAVSNEVREASAELHEAQLHYNEALFNPVLVDVLSEDQELAKKNLDQAYKRYHQAVIARIAFTDTVNRSTSWY